MKFTYDHDLHIHSYLSSCSRDPEQTPDAILAYAEENGMHTVCITDHFWDKDVPGASEWYAPQDYAHISQCLPLPQKEGMRFLFGCESDMTHDCRIGITREHFDLFDFVIIPTTHLHMWGFAISDADARSVDGRAETWVRKLDALLNMDIPFHKTGIAHLTCSLIAPKREEYLDVLSRLPEDAMHSLFRKAAHLGCGIELNMRYTDEERDLVLRPYRIAKQEGCRFYCGSDAHHPQNFAAARVALERAIDDLSLTEDDKFRI